MCYRLLFYLVILYVSFYSHLLVLVRCFSSFFTFFIISSFFFFVFFLFVFFFFFFFQAEDGIRDTSVTGVQTCALPISTLLGRPGIPPGDKTAGLPYLLCPAVQYS